MNRVLEKCRTPSVQQLIYKGSNKGEDREKGEGKISEEIMAERSHIYFKIISYTSRKLNKLQASTKKSTKTSL